MATAISAKLKLKNMKKILFIAAVLIIASWGIYSISKTTKKTSNSSEKLSIITTLFPQYEFAKEIGGDKIEVTLILPPGVEPHAYEPKPSDVSKINMADIFVYTGEFMEPWAHDIISGSNNSLKVVDASVGIVLMEKALNEGEEADHHHSGVDPHIWLNFENAKIMAKNIAQALAEIDPENAQYYQANLETYENKLTTLDNDYKNTLSNCESQTIIYGGHYAFGYLTKRYGLKYVAAQGFSPDSEPSAKDMIALTNQIKAEGIKTIFYQELASPKIAEILSNETRAKLLLLNGAHNLSKDDYTTGKTFVSLMEENLQNLSLGLNCQK
jgi:zinc transport system substrate-binding protein